MTKQALIILGKYPKTGNVKTRLAQKIGDKEAVDFYKNCCEYIFSEVEKIQDSITPYFYFGNKPDHQEIKDWIGEKFICIPPQHNNIEKHLHSAFAERLSEGASKIVSIATDVPMLSSEIILQAFKALDTYDVVLGPDHKNGFYLFGLKRFYPEVFEYQYQDRNNMFNEEVERINSLGLSYYILPALIDIDTEEDLKSLASSERILLVA